MAQGAASSSTTAFGQAGDGEEEVFLPSVEIQGLFTNSADYGRPLLNAELLMSSSYLPSSCRIHSKNKKEPWIMVQGWDLISVTYPKYCLPPSEFTPGNLPRFYRDLQPKLQRFLGHLVFQGEKWTRPEQQGSIGCSIGLERNLTLGFVHGMANGRGRDLVCNLMQELLKDILPDDDDRGIHVFNLGGASRKEPYQIRNVYFSLLYGINKSDPSKLSSSSPDDQPQDRSSSVSGRSGGDHQLRPMKRKHYDIDEFDSDDSQLDDKNRVWKKSLVPDVVCETYVIKTFMLVQSVVLTVSVKSSMGLQNPKDFNQLQCEMMPVVMKQKQAFGLIICPAEAMLVHMSYTEEKNAKQIVVLHSLRYEFISRDDSFNFAKFDQMCLDIIHYGKLMVQ